MNTKSLQYKSLHNSSNSRFSSNFITSRDKRIEQLSKIFSYCTQKLNSTETRTVTKDILTHIRKE